MNYYLDTSILLDYYEKRGKNGELAFQLIQKINQEKGVIFISDIHIRELKALDYLSEEIQKIFIITKPSSFLVHITKIEAQEARMLSLKRKVPFLDVLHAILARNNEALLISTDKHFESLKDICSFKKPEELI